MFSKAPLYGRPADRPFSPRHLFSLALSLCFIALTTVWLRGSFSTLSRLEHNALRDLAPHCSHITPISEQEYLTRQTRLAETLYFLGGKVYIAEPGANTQFYANFSSQWKVSERPLLMMVSPILSSSGQEIRPQITILTPKFEAERAKMLPIPHADAQAVRFIEWAEDADPYVTAIAAFEKLEPNRSKVYYVDGSIRKFISDGFELSGKDVTVETAPSSITALRERKSAAELAILKCVNEVTLLAIREVHKLLYPGIRESQARNLMAGLLSAAGTKGGCLTLFGENAALPHGSGTDRELAQSDFALFDCVAVLYGYNSDVTRTVALPRAAISSEQNKIWKLVQKTQASALSVAKNGTASGSVDRHARMVMHDSGGYEKYFTHRLGHGIGLEVHESPYLRGGSSEVIREGHTFSNEPGIYIRGEVGVRLEDCFYIAEDGKAVYLTEGVGGAARSPWDP